MATDLHERIKSAIEHRLTLAIATQVADDAIPEVERHCRADLERLNDHAPEFSRATELLFCAYDWADGDGWLTPWPCPEVLRLAAVYDLEVTDE